MFESWIPGTESDAWPGLGILGSWSAGRRRSKFLFLTPYPSWLTWQICKTESRGSDSPAAPGYLQKYIQKLIVMMLAMKKSLVLSPVTVKLEQVVRSFHRLPDSEAMFGGKGVDFIIIVNSRNEISLKVQTVIHWAKVLGLDRAQARAIQTQ